MKAKELNGLGIILDEKNFKLVKKVLKKDEEILKHNHPQSNILFTAVGWFCCRKKHLNL